MPETEDEPPEQRDSSSTENGASSSVNGKGYDPSLVQAGAVAFDRYCTDCHNAQRSLQKAKSLADWRATVLRMAEMEDADIPQSVHESIATYLVVWRDIGKGGSKPAGPTSGDEPTEQDSRGPEEKGPSGPAKGKGFDASLVRTGETAFNSHCISCHDAQKSLQASKNLAGWRTTVRRMAGKPDAQIPENVHESIATYLASRNQGGNGGKEGGGSGADGGSQFSFTGTFSPLWRGAEKALQDPGFFPSTWLGAAWQSEGPVSARATACTTCHSESKFDLVEAAVRFDVTKYLRSRSRCKGESEAPQASVAIEAGRFVVPFGAFYQQVNPGVYRTVSQPLIYNMGQRVFATANGAGDLGFPVLPMPYSDTGATTSIGLQIAENLNATFDAYLVNGLQGGANGIDFVQTRLQYYDNNSLPSGGGRFTIGDKYLRLGGSIMGGRFNSNAGNGPLNQGMDYLIFGLDAVFRWKDRLRVQFEYAQRNSDRLGTLPAAIFRERVGGFYLEGEAMISRRWNMSFLARYDVQSTQSLLPPPGSTLTTGDFTVQRFTYGLNWTLPGGSLLMLNNEHWFLPRSLGTVDVVGVRWAATF
ncbi:MAG TPA: hypothetical protein VND64_07440 [Pirellulales bacterium]|nr:hypothetical protein [Pirellulales bacterium]